MTATLPDRRTIPEGLRLDRWAAPDGGAIRRFAWDQPAGAPVRGSMLFQTGRADFVEKYLETLAYWHRRGWNLAGFDWRGQGGSPGIAGKAPGFSDLMSDLRAFIAEWQGLSVGPCVAVAHSMGGHLMLRWLAEDGAGLDAAVLVAPMLGLNSRPLPARVAAGLARLARQIGWGARGVLGAAGVTDGRQARLTGDKDRYADELYWTERQPEYRLSAPNWGWLADAYDSIAALDRAGVLETVTVPTLLIGTVNDRLVDAAAIVRAASRMSNAVIEMRTDCAHEMLREVDAVRDAVLARIDAFLEGVAPA